MFKLFVRLYLFIIVSLIVITALLDSVLLPKYQAEAPEQIAVIQLVEKLINSPNIPLQQLSNDDTWQLSEISSEKIAWGDEQLKHLDENGFLISYSEPNNQHIYIQNGNRLIKVDIPLVNSDNNISQYLILMFVIFAVFLGIWLLPLWRELLQVKRLSEVFDNTGKLPLIKTSATTTLTPILSSLNQLGERIDELLENQKALSGTLAHEIRTPLARLKFRLEQLPNSHQHIKDEIQHDIDSMQSLLQHMLDYTKMQSLNPELDIGEVPLHTLVQQIAHDTPFLYNSDITISLSAPEVIIKADGILVERAITNLASNALKYANSEVKISLTQSAEETAISVWDDGHGIAPEKQNEIFQPYIQFPQNTHSGKHSGAGIGLALVTLIQKWHGGQVSVVSEPSNGTTFTLTYPRL